MLGNLMIWWGWSLLDIFPELIGLEEDLSQLAHNWGPPLIIPEIYRPPLADKLPTQTGPHSKDFGSYFDLQIEAFRGVGSCLLLLAVDVTDQAQMEFGLRQERNELRLNWRKPRRGKKG